MSSVERRRGRLRARASRSPARASLPVHAAGVRRSGKLQHFPNPPTECRFSQRAATKASAGQGLRNHEVDLCVTGILLIEEEIRVAYHVFLSHMRFDASSKER